MTTPSPDQATTNVAPVVKTRTVPLEPDAAFDLFTRRMGEWWPLDTFYVARDEIAEVVFEERVGGQLLEVTTGGERNSWADVTAWDPPDGFRLAWHPSLATSSDLEVTFSAVEGGTEVRIVHTGWERFGDSGPDIRDDYNTGWDPVLDLYAASADAT